jgi:long-chain acyl-CoA synthetase
VVKDQEQVDKVVEIWDRIKDNVIKVVVWDIRGMSHYFERYSFLIYFKDVFSSTKSSRGEDFLKEISVTPKDTAMLSLTSGTSGLPKLSKTSHENLISAAEIWQQVHPFYESDEIFSLFPLAWGGEQFSVSRWLHTGCLYNFPESPETVKNDFRECQPTVLMSSPRMYEDICSEIRARMEDASFAKKLTYNYSLRLGLEHAQKMLIGEQGLKFPKKWVYSFLMATTLRSLRQRVGLARVRFSLTGGAAISREVFTFYMAMDMNLIQIFGLTENVATATCHYPGDVRLETVGKPLPKIQIRIDDEGMIYVKSPTNTTGYFNNHEETSKAIQDGWFKTGDSGYFDEYQHLVVIDRFKDLMFLKDGTRFSPQELENRLKFSPYIKQAVVFGDKRNMVTALISIDMENVANWANKRNIPYTTLMDLSQNDEVTNLIREEIRRINERLPEKMRMRRFVLLPKELHPDDEELTRTRKVKRNVINQRYGPLVESMYRGEERFDLSLEIIHSDGKISSLKCQVRQEDI